MYPVLSSSGGLTIYTYGVLVSLGILLSLWYCRTQGLRMGLSPSRIWNLRYTHDSHRVTRIRYIANVNRELSLHLFIIALPWNTWTPARF